MSFNVKNFGTTKFSKVEVVDQLVQVSYTARETLCCPHYSHVHVCADIPPVRRGYTDWAARYADDRIATICGED